MNLIDVSFFYIKNLQRQLYGGISYKKWSLADLEVAVVKINGVNNYMVEPSNATTVFALDLGLIF